MSECDHLSYGLDHGRCKGCGEYPFGDDPFVTNEELEDPVDEVGFAQPLQTSLAPIEFEGKWNSLEEAKKALLDRADDVKAWTVTLGNEQWAKVINHIHAEIARVGLREWYFTNSEISRATSVHPSTVNRIINQLAGGQLWTIEDMPRAHATSAYRANRLKHYAASGKRAKLPRLVRLSFTRCEQIVRPSRINKGIPIPSPSASPIAPAQARSIKKNQKKLAEETERYLRGLHREVPAPEAEDG
jgi:hypothetical protein